MSRQVKNIRQALQTTGFFFPFTWYFTLFIAGCWIGYQWLIATPAVPGSAYDDIFELLLRIAILFSAVILIAGLLSVLVPYLFFKWRAGKGGIDFHIQTITPKEKVSPKQSKRLFSFLQARGFKQTVHLYIHPLFYPLLGFIKIRLQYDNDQFSEKFSLIEKTGKKLFNNTVDGVYHWPLPEIKEYRVEKAIIYFEDFFQFFSLAVSIKINSRFHTQPFTLQNRPVPAVPRKTEDTNTRIDEIKKLEGEFLNYKNFENHDDVRRIVWKIYARNKELVVRIPEVLDPYASHIYLYASFFTSFDAEGNEVIEVPFLNYYKAQIWTIYQNLVKQQLEVRFIADQETSTDNFSEGSEQVKYKISVSKWQTDKDLKTYIQSGEASIVIISSLSDAEQVQELIERHGHEISFVFVSLTESLQKQYITDWIQWLFVEQEKDDMAVYKTNWSLSLIKSKIVRNEKALKKILQSYQKAVAL